CRTAQAARRGSSAALPVGFWVCEASSLLGDMLCLKHEISDRPKAFTIANESIRPSGTAHRPITKRCCKRRELLYVKSRHGHIEDFEDLIGLTILACGLITAIVVYTLSIRIGRWCVQRVFATRTATDFNEGDRGE
ncbi:hypothetical protein, partial [Pandoraea sp.]|uniref:hypothetical protein n=1 Tax=Pandoraea sp. TaxID=1883445 RepID=UPI0035AE1470